MEMRNKNRTSIPDQVMNEVLDAIRSGEIGPGEKLPSEHELCEQFGVSRPSIKTAIDRLNLLGIVEQKVGDGTYVKDSSTSDFIDIYAQYFIRPQELPELLQLSYFIESGCVRDLAAAPGVPLLNALIGLWEQIDQAARSDDRNAVMQHAAAFHQMLCESGQNRYAAQLGRILRTAFEPAARKLNRQCGHIKQTNQAMLLSLSSHYRQICLALGQHDGDFAARELTSVYRILTTFLQTISDKEEHP